MAGPTLRYPKPSRRPRCNHPRRGDSQSQCNVFKIRNLFFAVVPRFEADQYVAIAVTIQRRINISEVNTFIFEVSGHIIWIAAVVKNIHGILFHGNVALKAMNRKKFDIRVTNSRLNPSIDFHA